MTSSETNISGTVQWLDLTVPNAEAVRDFYTAVAGWESSGVDMGGYEDYCVQPAGAADPIGGICHARGTNADMPAQWLIYITVSDLDAAIVAVEANGGSIVAGPQGGAGKDRYCVFKDPAGAVAALFQPAHAT